MKLSKRCVTILCGKENDIDFFTTDFNFSFYIYVSTSSLFTLTSYLIFAGVAELADAPDLGSGGTPVQVQVLSPAPITKESLTWLFCYFMRKVIGLEPALKRYSPTTVALPRESTFLNEGFKIYFKTEIASEIVFSKASRPYLSTSALFFSPWVRQPAPPIHPPTHAIPSIKFA